MTDHRQIENVTCLGCGCGCDDVTVTVSGDRIVAAAPLCPMGQVWLGDGRVPSAIVSEGRPATLEAALSKAASELARAGSRSLIYLAPDLTTQAQRAALVIADLLRATVDSSTSETAANGLIAVQRRGRAGATLGELRNRGDAFLFWGVDPGVRYPRFLERYGIEPVGTHVPQGRRGRHVISVSVGSDKALDGADLSLEIEPEQEIPVLSLMRASVLGHRLPESSPVASRAAEISARLAQARYAVLVHDAEPTAEPRNLLRAEALIALAQVLNGKTRCALCSLRAGRNQVGAEAVLTWQTGYPVGVDYSRGYPSYLPGNRGVSRLLRGAYAAALITGSALLEPDAQAAFAAASTIVIGPRASEAPFRTSVAIDTGVAGIHEGGLAYRMDEVPLTLRPPLPGPLSTTDVLLGLHGALRQELRGASR
jgi:formylmethanofuran dehydrogenase subunit B